MEVETEERQNTLDYCKQKQTNIDIGNQDSIDMKQGGFLTSMEDKQVILNRNGSEIQGDLLMNKPCMNTTVEDCKDKSDIRELLNDNSSCQLTNQTLGTKLLSSTNPSLERNSKLRVSVFDHRIIPRKFITNRINLNRIVDYGGSDLESDDNILQCAKDNEMKNGKRKGLQLSYAQLKRRNNLSTDSSKDSSPDMDKGNFRTQFDVLLRSLIGDVNDMQMDTSPMTISSGYESDYIQTKEADIDDIFKKNTGNKENIEAKNDVKKSGEKQNGYFLMPEKRANSDSLSSSTNKSESQVTHGLRTAFSSMPCFPTQPAIDIGSKQISKEAPVIRCVSQNDSNEFSYAQRHNYKLTKVTRSMYEIIHDLQCGEKLPNDNKRRSRKGRRAVQEGSANTDGNTSAREIKSRGRLQSADLLSGNNVNTSSLNANNRPNFSGSVVRCVRRPLANDSSLLPTPRMPPRGEGNSRAESNNSDKVQNDLRNLLCSTSDGQLSGEDNNVHFDPFNGFSRMDSKQDVFKGVIDNNSDNVFNRTNLSISHDTSIIGQEGHKRLTLTEQFNQRLKADEHVYETIPGDEKLYEEWKKMRATSRVPRIRRFTTVPDLPGTFVPKEPPALPERRYLSTSVSSQKDSENHNYIFMGDINSNIPAKANSERSDSGYASVASDRVLPNGHTALNQRRNDVDSTLCSHWADSRTQNCDPYPLHTDPVIHQHYRSDETSDGYCSIDNLSLCQEPLPHNTTYPSLSLDRRLPPTSNRPPLNRNARNDYLSNPITSRQSNNVSGTFGSDPKSRQVRFETRFFETRRSDGSESDSMLMSSAFDRDSGRTIVQGTYV